MWGSRPWYSKVEIRPGRAPVVYTFRWLGLIVFWAGLVILVAGGWLTGFSSWTWPIVGALIAVAGAALMWLKVRQAPYPGPSAAPSVQPPPPGVVAAPYPTYPPLTQPTQPSVASYPAQPTVQPAPPVYSPPAQPAPHPAAPASSAAVPAPVVASPPPIEQGYRASPPATPTPSVPAQTPSCARCGRPTTYIPQYGRYFCYPCNLYLEQPFSPPSNPPPSAPAVGSSATTPAGARKKFWGKRGQSQAPAQAPYQASPPSAASPSPGPYPAAATPAPVVEARVAPPGPILCSACGRPATYIEQYGRYYCYPCNRYI